MDTRSMSARGFSFLELLVGLAVGILVVAGGFVLVRQGLSVNSRISNRVEMQQNLRVGLNLVARDLSAAGTGTPLGGLQLPGGAGAVSARFACDPTDCYVTDNIFSDDRLYPVTPGDGKGAVIDGITTDVVTLMYRDFNLPLDDYSLLSVKSGEIQVDSRTDPPINDSTVGIRAGEVLVLCNVNGCAAAVVSSLSGDRIYLADGDPLGFNQSGAEYGNLASLANPAPPVDSFPPTVAYRVSIVTYYIDGQTGRLMRQVNALKPWPVAEEITDFQLTYDLFDIGASAMTAGLSNAGSAPNQIRKVRISINARAHEPAFGESEPERIGLSTAVSTRNLAFRDRYK